MAFGIKGQGISSDFTCPPLKKLIGITDLIIYQNEDFEIEIHYNGAFDNISFKL